MQKPHNPNPFGGWKDGYNPSPTTTRQCRAQKRREPCVSGCPAFPQGHTGRRTGDGHGRSPGQERPGAVLPATPAAGAAPAGPLHPPPPQHLLLLLPLPRAGAALPRGHLAVLGQTRAAQLSSHHGRRGACRDLPAPRSAPPPLPAPLRPGLLPALPLHPARPDSALPGQSRSGVGAGALLWKWDSCPCPCAPRPPAQVPLFPALGRQRGRAEQVRGAEGLYFAPVFVLALE